MQNNNTDTNTPDYILWWDGINENHKIYAISTDSRCSLGEAKKIWNDCQGEITDEKIKEIYLSNKYDIDNPSTSEHPPLEVDWDLYPGNEAGAFDHLDEQLNDKFDELVDIETAEAPLEVKEGEQTADLTHPKEFDTPVSVFLAAENEKLKRLLHDLTPGGSEFYNEPEKCAKWIAENRESTHYTMAGIIAEKKKENKALKERVETLQTALGELWMHTKLNNDFPHNYNHHPKSLYGKVQAALTPIE